VPRFIPGFVLAACLAACGHSETFLPTPPESDGPFDPAPPTRLTYNGADDFAPVVSAPGEVSYLYRRGTSDHDICAGILPIAGGHRLIDICAWGDDDLHRADRMAGAVLLDDNQVAWTWHRGGTGNQAPSLGGLYVASRDEPHRITEKVSLLSRPTGATDRWDVLISPRRTGPQEITALAALWYISPTVQFGPVDTVYLGVELARIDLSTTPATITVLAPAPDAVDWTIDPADGSLYYHRPFYAPPTEQRLYDVAADTIYRVTGGEATPIWGRPTLPDQISARLTGFAVSHGRLFVADVRQVLIVTPTGPQIETRSTIAEVAGETTIAELARRIDGGRWGPLTIGSDGHNLIAESNAPGGRDLYLVEAQP
jgi:hypothetical protein